MMTIPPRLTIAEVMDLTGFTEGAIINRTHKGKFPKPLFHNRKYGRVYSGEEVYRALGFTKDVDSQQAGFHVF